MGGATNSNGTAAAKAQINQFLGNLGTQFSGKGNVQQDAANLAISAKYAYMANAAGEAGRLPGIVGVTGTVVSVAVGAGTSGGNTCSVIGVVAGTVGGIAAGAAATPGGPVFQFWVGASAGTLAQKAATALCQTSLGYVNGAAPASQSSSIQASSAQALQQAIATTSMPAPVSAPAPSDASSLAASIVKFRPSPDYTGSNGIYTVQSGQNLTGIAKANGIPLSQLLATNPQITDPNSIRSGQVIQLPTNASGYVPGQNNSGGVPNNAVQTSTLTSVLQQSAGSSVSVVTENSGQIAVLSATTGLATVIANDGTVSTISLDSYHQQAQSTYNSYVANGYVNPNTQVSYADYQNNVYGSLNANGQSTIATSAGMIYQDANGNIAAQSATGSLYAYNSSTQQSLLANNSGNGSSATLIADIQATNPTTGNQTNDLKTFNGNGAVQGEVQIGTSSTGAVSAYISGAGGMIDLSNSAITLAPGATATITGNGNTITVDSKDQATVVGNGNTTTLAPPSGLQTLAHALPTVIDALSFIKAIQTGQPLPVVASGLTLANALTSTTVTDAAGNIVSVTPASYGLAGAASVGNGILSVMSLDAALKRGDTLGATIAGALFLTAVPGRSAHCLI
jgi:LysM repeat protein